MLKHRADATTSYEIVNKHGELPASFARPMKSFLSNNRFFSRYKDFVESPTPQK